MMSSEPDCSLLPALEALSIRDRDFARAFACCGCPPHRVRPGGFEGLVRMIVSQQISVQAASTIYARFEQAGPELSARAVLALSNAQLKAIGLSRPKQDYIRSLAQAVEGGVLDFSAFDRMADEAIITTLTEVKGIGRWTAEIYLLFALNRPDVFPAADLALQTALARLKGLENRPRERQTRELVKNWHPWRSAGARFLWHYYRHAGVA